MDETYILVGIIHIFVAALVSVMSIPLIKGEIEPNRYYGIRLKKAYQSPELWYEINRHGGKCLVGWSGIIAAMSLLGFCIHPQPGSIIFYAFIFSPLLLIVATLQTWWHARKL
jgi:hypothetical protein